MTEPGGEFEHLRPQSPLARSIGYYAARSCAKVVEGVDRLLAVGDYVRRRIAAAGPNDVQPVSSPPAAEAPLPTTDEDDLVLLQTIEFPVDFNYFLMEARKRRP